MPELGYRFRIYTSDATVFSTGNIAYETTSLGNIPVVRTPTAAPLDGRTEAVGWTINLLDVNSTLADQLSNSTGRYVFLNRLVSLERRVLPASFTTFTAAGFSTSVIGGGRIVNIDLAGVAGFDFEIQDDRYLEREARVFSTNTTRLYPPGPSNNWLGHPPETADILFVQGQTTGGGSLQRWAFVQFIRPAGSALPTQGAISAMANDIKDNPRAGPRFDSSGNFRHLRWRIPSQSGGDGVEDFEIHNFGLINDPILLGSYPREDAREGFGFSDYLADRFLNPDGPAVGAWLIATSSQLNDVSGGDVAVGQYSGTFLHMYTAPPSQDTPLHITWRQPFELYKQIAVDGDYVVSTGALPRISTTHVDSLRALPIGEARWRITEPANMAEWFEEALYRPYLVVPFSDEYGRLLPTFVGATPTNAPFLNLTFTATNCAEHPTWSLMGRDQVAQVVFTVPQYQRVVTFGGANALPDGAADRIRESMHTHRYTHSVAGGVGRGSWEVTQRANHPRYAGTLPVMPPYIFNRWGDGPIMGSLVAFPDTLSTLTVPGARGRINLDTFPNSAQTSGRGGFRYIQVMGRTITPAGIEYEYLDAGPPTIVGPPIINFAAAADPQHQVNVTVGSVPTVGHTVIQYAISSAVPSSGSTLWSVAPAVASSGTYQIPSLPTNSTVFVRAANLPVNAAFLSSFVTTGPVRTTGLSSATGLGTTSLTGGYGTLTWTNGEDGYDVRVYLWQATGGAHTFSATSEVFAVLPPDSRRFTVQGLTSDEDYHWGVQYVDPYGGVSAIAQSSFNGTSTTATATAMLGISILDGVGT